MPELTEAEVKYTKTNTNWTNDNVTGITTTIELNTDKNVEGYTIQYTKFAEGEEVTTEKLQNATWENYEASGIVSKQNEIIYSRLYDGTNATTYTSTTISNIDIEKPTINTELNSSNATTKGFNLNIGITDTKSGLGKIEWYYKLSTAGSYTKVEEEYTPLNGSVVGATSATTKTKAITNLTGGTYSAYAIVYDVAGNSEQSGTIEIALPYAVTFNGTNVTSNGANTANPNSTYTATLTLTSGYGVSNIVVKMGGSTLEENTNYTYSDTNSTLTIPNVNGDIEIIVGTQIQATVEAYRQLGLYTEEKTTLEDSNKNLVIVPEGFKIAEDSGINITEGVVIEDNDVKTGIGNNRGNQYVWIPVGETLKKSDGSTVNIELGRYVFADGTNHKGEDGNTPLAAGTPILMQSAKNYASETEIHITDQEPTSKENFGWKELKDYRAGVASAGTNGLNATALNLKGFIDSVKANGGYYIARYEASYGTDGKANSKVSNTYADTSTAPTAEGQLWNNITQINATTASRNLYTTINSDLMNSYAWDTAIVYIQNFSNDTDYSKENGKTFNISLTNTGANGDEVCKINDMASNTCELTTEYSSRTFSTSAIPCIYRGGYYGNSYGYTSGRYDSFATDSHANVAFRTALYM